MEQYSRRFIEELANHIDPVIIDYFNKKRNHVYKKDHVGTNHTLMILIQSALTMPNTL